MLRPIASTPPSSPTATLAGSVETSGKRFVIACRYAPEQLAFLSGLPNSKYMKAMRQWSCQATPLAAWKLRDAGLELDDAAGALADQWDAAVAPPVRGSVDTSHMKMTPLPHQVAAMEFANYKPGTLIAMGMGAMKTATSIGLMMNWRARTVLVVCPKSVLGVWRGEMLKHCSLSQNVVVLDSGTPKKKADDAMRCIAQRGNYAVSMVVVNYETSWRKPLDKVIGDFEWDLMIADESHRCADANSIQSKFAFQCAMNAKRRLLLTGTPMENLLGMFAQFKLMEPALFGTSYTRYRARYAITHEQYKNRVLQTINQDEWLENYKKLCFRVETLDVIKLPEVSHIEIPVVLEPKTRKAYATLKKECLLEVERGEVTAQNAGVKMIRLASMACGHLKRDDGVTIRVGDEKKQALKDLISDIPPSESVVVFCRFTEDLRQVEEVASELKRRYAEISGSRKDALTEHAKLQPYVQICGVQERAGGVGIDLTHSRRAIFFSHGYSLKDALQAYARVHRPGQKHPTFIYHLVAQDTIDGAVMKALSNKEDVVNEVLSHIRWDRNA